MAGKILFIEGDETTVNGDLRQGFSKLLAQKLKGNLPRIKLGGGKQGTLDKFLNNRLGGRPVILFDLDGPEAARVNDLNRLGLAERTDDVFYMVQEMESWFLSQPDVLNKFYGSTIDGKKVSELIPKKNPQKIEHPKEVLKRITKALNKKEEYHEIKHAVEY